MMIDAVFQTSLPAGIRSGLSFEHDRIAVAAEAAASRPEEYVTARS
jgi:hypothetical protein